MKQLAIDDGLGDGAQAGYRFPGVRPAGACRSALFAPSGFSLQMAWATLPRGTALHWTAHGGDQVLYVVSGSTSTGEARCPAGGVLLIDEGAVLTLRADRETVILHFGRQDGAGRRAPRRARGRVRVVGPAGTYATVDAERETRFYADSDDDFPATFFSTGRTGPYRSLPHSHSQDEIIYVADGGLTLGSRPVPVGSAIAVPRDRRYGFRGADTGFTLLNYRPGPSYFSGSDGGAPFLEGGRATGMARVEAAEA
jgi:quercetin dioxygenase-like cupin family protein